MTNAASLSATDDSGTAPRFLDRYDLIALALVAIGLAGMVALPFGPNRLGDMDFFVEAKTLAAAVKGGVGWSEVAITKAPGPVLYYFIPFLAVPTNSPVSHFWLAGMLWSGLWTGVSILLIRRCAELLAGATAGLLGMALPLFLPLSIYYSTGILAEPPAFLGAVLLAAGWLRAWKLHDFTRRSWRSLLLAGTGGALLCLSRPNALPLLALLFLYAVALRHSLIPIRRRSAAAAAAIAVIGLAALVASMPLTRLFHGRQQAVRQEFYLAYTMLMGKFQYRTEPWNWAYWDERRIGTADYDQWCAQGRRLGQEASERDLPLSTVYWSWIGRDCMEHPLLTARMAGTRCLSMNLLFANSASPAKFRVGPIPGLWVYSLTHAVVNALLLGVLIAAALTLRQVRQSPMLLVLALPYVALLAFSSLTYGEPRYLFAAQPGLAILAAVTLTPAVRMVLRRLSLVPRAWRHAWAGRS